MVLNRRKFAKNSSDLIRRKFSIDAGPDAALAVRSGKIRRVHHFETIPSGVPEPGPALAFA
jgi:hypothetical protein